MKNKEEWKLEIKKELLEELKLEIKKELKLKNNYFDFDQYKIDVVKNDIDKVEKFLNEKYKWVWFIPVIGFYIYTYHLSVALSDIDRGLLKKNLTKKMWPLYLPHWWILFTLYMYLINLFPLNMKRYLKKAIEDTKRDIGTNKN